MAGEYLANLVVSNRKSHDSEALWAREGNVLPCYFECTKVKPSREPRLPVELPPHSALKYAEEEDEP